MKKIIAILLCLSFVLVAFAACNKEEQPDDQDKDPVVDPTDSDEPTDSDTDPVDSDPDPVIPDEPVDDIPVLDLEGVEAVRYSSLGQDATYTIGGGDKLMSFFEEPFESFLGVCKYYEDNDFELYGYNVLGTIHSATYTRGNNMYHIYWAEGESKLNIVSSKNAGALPTNAPEVTTGDVKTSVTQIQSTEINGQGYVVQLADGSFIINDGGYAHRVDELWDTLKTLNGSEEGIIIRAWFITHFPCFTAFADKYASKVTLE